MSIVSLGNPVAVREDLTVDKIKVRNNSARAITRLDVRFELALARGEFPPVVVSQIQTDPACVRDQLGRGDGVVCHYPVQIAPGATAELVAKLRLDPTTASSTGPAPSLKVTVGTGATGDSRTTGPITRVQRRADLTVKLADTHLKGRVGDTVDVRWTITNGGPDTIAATALEITLVAPPGTEWTGDAAARCVPPRIPKTKYACTSDEPLQPGPAHALTETWQLKIVSPPAGDGEIRFTANRNAGSPDPYLDTTDPNPADNVVAIRIQVDDTDPNGAADALVSGVYNGATMTGTGMALIVAGGFGALALCTLLVVRARRRAARHG
ncbi:hypothetical protein GCM10023176_28070 [Micromonospora coerulea]|uniref:DUF11 domain-containing protein n=1 Tax=Micromonospora coerulea TaxID=47856 RepID=A0ABP8SMB4_9ACTN